MNLESSFFKGAKDFKIDGGNFNIYTFDQTDILMRNLMRQLRPRHYVSDPFTNHRQARLQGTCEWALENPLIKHWLRLQRGCDHLWIYGGPGTGKSVLAAFLIEHVRQHQDEITLYHFCEDKDHPVHILRDFIWQILVRVGYSSYPRLGELVQIFSFHPDDFEFSIAEIEPFFLDLIGLFQQKRLVIDGLDECQEPAVLLQVVAKVANAKALVLSRKEKYIEDQIRNWDRLEIGGASNPTTERDLESFINHLVNRLIDEYPLLAERSDHLKVHLRATSGCMFQYALLKYETIRDIKPATQTHVKDAMRLLETYLPGLTTLYDKYLSRRLSENTQWQNEMALRTFQWILYSPQPVTLNFLRHSLAINLAKDEGILSDNLAQDIKSEISKSAGILVKWHPGNQVDRTGTHFASLVHHSVREYLISLTSQSYPQMWRDLDLPYNALSGPSSHSSLLSACMIVASGEKVWESLRAYHDSADGRRKVCPNSQKRLEKQICIETTWDSWEGNQLGYLEEDWSWMNEEEAHLRAELEQINGDSEPLAYIQNTRKRLIILGQAQSPRLRAREHKSLSEILSMRERDLMVYAFAHVGYHLPEAETDLRNFFLKAALFRLIPSWRDYAHSVLRQIVIIQMPKRGEDAYTRDLIVALESFLIVLEIIERLCQSPSSWTAWPQLLWFGFSSYFAARVSASSPVWSEGTIAALATGIPPAHLQFLFFGVTNLIISLNDIELAIHNYDIEIHPITGMGILLHSIRYCGHALAQWMVCQHVGHLDKPDIPPLRDDHFLFPKLYLTSLPTGRRSRSYISPPKPSSHPAVTVFVFTVSVCCLLGYNGLRLLQFFLIGMRWALYYLRQYSFHTPGWSSHSLQALMCCLPLPFLAQILPLSSPTSMMIASLPLAGIYGYRGAIHRNMLANHRQFGQVDCWLSNNMDFILSLYNSCAAYSLETQLNIFILFLVVGDAIHFAIDPYSLHCVLGLYQKVDTGSDGSDTISVERVVQ